MGDILIESGSLEADAVVPQCLDAQYLSDRAFREMIRLGVDRDAPTVAELRQQDFQSELNRSLLYSSQVVIQRAHFSNNELLYRHYLPSNRTQLRAFAGLMRQKAIVPYLFCETSLREKPHFEVIPEGHAATQALLDEVGDPVTCVRLAVDDAENRRRTSTMATAFGAQLSRVEFLDGEQRNALAAELFSDPKRLETHEAWQAFDRSLNHLVDYVIAKGRQVRDKEGRTLSRTDFYIDNFMVPGSANRKLILGRFKPPSSDNPFLPELKKYVDLVYNTNLPDHLHRFTFTPTNMPSRMALQDTPGVRYEHDKLYKVLTDPEVLDYIRRCFMANTQKAMNLPLLRDLSIADIQALRSKPEWSAFRDAQARILKHPLQCADHLEDFQQSFDTLQRAISSWYQEQREMPRTIDRYCNYVSMALSIGGKLVVAGSDMDPYIKVAANTATDISLSSLPKRVKGYAAKLLVGVYDVGEHRLDAERTYSVELMQTAEELTREDVIDLLQSISRKKDKSLPGLNAKVADQGIQ